jgi:hypothetical protein
MGEFSPTKLKGDCEEIANLSTAYGRRRRNWIDAHGSVPAGQVVDASCGNKHCIMLRHWCALVRTCLAMKSTPLPQLFPSLDKCLHLARARDATVNESAVPVALLVKVSHGGQAKMGESLSEFLEVLLAQHLRFSAVGASGHTGRILRVRLLFANSQFLPRAS